MNKKFKKFMSVLLVSTILCTGLTGCSSNETKGTSVNDEPKLVYQADQAIVSTATGKVRGYIDNKVYTYKGIQYATAERFQMPQPVPKWEGIKDAVIYGGIAPQTPQTTGIAEVLNTHYYYPQEEDETKIQTLNIWSPEISDSAKKPVMVWLHGGGFDSGASNEQIGYDGRNMSERGDVVVVSINHRLNCLGFLDVSEFGEEYKYSGNLGMADIVAALEWIKENVAQFGGDPDNVTLFGQSGGAGKIMTLLGMPVADGLYDKVIMQSCWPEFVSKDGAQKIAKETMDNLNISSVEELKEVPYQDLYDASMQAQNKLWEEVGEDYAGFYPEIDGDYIPENIWTEETIGQYGFDIPVMIGTTFSEESIGDVSLLTGEEFNKNAVSDEEAMERLKAMYGDHTEAIVEEFKTAYPNKKIIDALYLDNAYYYPLAEGSYRNGSMKVTNLKAAQGGADVYCYQFAYDFPLMGGINAWHCSEIPFVFGNIDKVGITTGLTKEAYDLQDMMCDAWVAFAKNGNPNHENMIDWPAYTTEEGATMIFESKSRVGYHFDDALRSEIGKWLEDIQ